MIKNSLNLSRASIFSLLLLLPVINCTLVNEPEKIEKSEFVPVLVIHGGAGIITEDNLTPELEEKIINTLEESLRTGYKVLAKGGNSTEAVIETIRIMEESPLFNAGKGAVFTHDGKNELDAAIMDGKSGMAGAVAGVTRIKSPISAAYAVLTESDHVLLTGKGAEEFAESAGLEMVDPEYFFTRDRYERLLKMKEKDSLRRKEMQRSYMIGISDNKFGTVGAVALDKHGNLAAGNSTGGMTNKRYGRVGDVPIIGAGTYADNNTCAVAATGHGEFFIRNVVAYDIAARMKYKGKDLGSSAEEVISELKDKGGFGGVICLDCKGNIAMPFNTEGMYRGYITEDGEARILLYGTNKGK